MTTLTPWFDGKIHKPVRPGVYQVRLPGACVYRHWDGKTWGLWYFTAALVNERGVHPIRETLVQDDWRGICKSREDIGEEFLERMAEHMRKEIAGPEWAAFLGAPFVRAGLWEELGDEAEQAYWVWIVQNRDEKETK